VSDILGVRLAAQEPQRHGHNLPAKLLHIALTKPPQRPDGSHST
jgi:hypothetical protein